MRSTALLAVAGGLLAASAACGPPYYGYAYCDPTVDPSCGYYGYGYCDPTLDPSCGYGVVDYVGVGIDPYGYCSDPFSCGCIDPTVCLTKAEPAASACTPGDGSCIVRALATSTNGALQSVLEPVDALLSERPTTGGDVAVYGPVDAPAPGARTTPVATFRLSVRRATGTTTWKLEGEPLDRSAGWSTLFTGSMSPGKEPRRGRGVLGVDLDALSALNPTVFPGGGKLLGAFANDGDQKATSYRLEGFRTGSAVATDGELTSATAADGAVRTVFAAAGEAPVQVDGSATPLSSGGVASSPAGPLQAGTPPDAMPSPGF